DGLWMRMCQGRKVYRRCRSGVLINLYRFVAEVGLRHGSWCKVPKRLEMNGDWEKRCLRGVKEASRSREATFRSDLVVPAVGAAFAAHDIGDGDACRQRLVVAVTVFRGRRDFRGHSLPLLKKFGPLAITLFQAPADPVFHLFARFERHHVFPGNLDVVARSW